MGNRFIRPLFLALSLSLCSSIGSAQDPSPSPSPWDQVLNRINEVRKAAGLQAVEEDPKLSAGCQLHAAYLARNHGRPELESGGMHREDESFKGYTEAGAKSAARSIIGYSDSKFAPVSEIDGLVATVFHRVHLLAPRLTKVGIGIAVHEKGGHYVVVDTMTRDGKTLPKINPVLWPHQGQEGVPLEFALGSKEWPDPRPDPKARAGYPVTIDFSSIAWKPGEVTLTITAAGKEVASWLSTPDKPAVADYPQHGLVCLLPKEKLKPSTKYTVAIRCKQFGLEGAPEWSKEWSFTTAAK